MAKRKKVKHGNVAKGATAKINKTKIKPSPSTALRKRNYTRSPYQKTARRGNDILRQYEESGLKSDTIETIKSSIEIINEEIGKKGRKDRIYSGNDLSEEDKRIIEKLVNELDEENKRIKKALKSKERKKQYDISDQDYIDELDTIDDIFKKSFSELGLSSQQIKDISDIAKSKDMHMDTINNLKKEVLQRLMRENIRSGLKLRDINVDKFTEYMRNELYNA